MLITLEDFKEQVLISDKLPEKEIIPHIKHAEERYLKSTLCNDLYREISESVINCDMDAKQEELMTFIRPFLIQKSYVRYISFNGVKGTSQGLVTITGDNTATLTDNQLNTIKKRAESDSEYYENELINYLEKNKEVFTNYNCKGCVVNKQSFKITAIGKNHEGGKLL